MNINDAKFYERRAFQSCKLPEVQNLVSTIKLKERTAEVARITRREISDLDTENLISIFKAFGVSTSRYGVGMYLHPIELTKALNLFANDHKTDEHLDSGVRRVIRILSKVNSRLLKERLVLTNYPGAGYRIASNTEAIDEVHKSIYRSFGNIRAALTKAERAVDPEALTDTQKERFIEVKDFCDRMTEEFKAEIFDDEIDSPEAGVSEVFDSPPL